MLVCSDQTHTNYVRVVTEAGPRKFDREKDYHDERASYECSWAGSCDVLCRLCAAVFTDPVHRALDCRIPAGDETVSDIAGETVKIMRRRTGQILRICRAIGPSICQDYLK